MKIHLNRGGQSLGQFTPEEVRAGFREGRFLGTDLAWRDGMPMWKPLAEVIDELAPQADTPAGAVAPAVPVETGFPWEKRREVGFFPAVFETIRLVLIEPGRAFTAMPLSGGLGAPLFFYVLIGTIGALVGVFYQTAFGVMDTAATPEQQAVMAALSSVAVIGAVIMLMPFVLVAVAFFSAGLLHLMLMVLGGANRPFEATFRVVCYAGGATAVLQLLPICGSWLATGWYLVALIIGISQVQNIGKWRAAVAILLPAVLCCVLILTVIIGTVVFLGGAAAGGFFEQALREASAP